MDAEYLFKKLGYRKRRNKAMGYFEYVKEDEFDKGIMLCISFDTTNKTLMCSIYKKGAVLSRGLAIFPEEFKAIQEQMKELRLVMKKEWKEIKGYEGKYIISNYGEIISLPRYKENKGKMQYVEPREICKYVNKKNGYVYVQLWNNAEYKNIRLHRLVAEHFVEKIIGKEQINHIDGNKQNNRADNLEWCTCKENIQHAYRTGLIRRAIR